MKTLRQILASKGGKLVTVAPDDSGFHGLAGDGRTPTSVRSW
jgi:hypothetical protein